MLVFVGVILNLQQILIVVEENFRVDFQFTFTASFRGSNTINHVSTHEIMALCHNITYTVYTSNNHELT